MFHAYMVLPKSFTHRQGTCHVFTVAVAHHQFSKAAYTYHEPGKVSDEGLTFSLIS